MQELPPILDEQLADHFEHRNDPSYMRIHNLSGLPLIDYRLVKPLQGGLKELTKANHDKLMRVLHKRGFTTPLFVWRNPDTSELFLLDGHQRQRVMTKNDMSDDGHYEVPYVLIPGATVTEAKEQLLEITSQYGHMTIEGLDEFAVDLGNLDDLYFDAIDMDKWLDELTSEDDPEDDEAPEVDEVNPPVSKLGEIYQLGRHRLMCGDSTDFGTVSELMDGAQADMVLTDPPYGMFLDTDFSSIRGSKDALGGGRGGNKYDKVIGDHDDFTPELITVIFDAFSYCKEMFLFGADYFAELLPDKNDGSWCVWDKRKESQEDAIGAEFELIWSKQKHKRRMLRHDWFGFLSSQNGADARNRVHPTQKPLTLLVDIMKQWGKKGDAVVDLYGGSGSTLIACEQTGRTCYMMELDPKYVDVIRKRYAKHIGQEDRWVEATPIVGGLDGLR